jgi:hypothetical protein
MADADQPPVEPALARVTIFEVAEREWGWLSTSAQVDDRITSDRGNGAHCNQHYKSA